MAVASFAASDRVNERVAEVGLLRIEERADAPGGRGAPREWEARRQSGRRGPVDRAHGMHERLRGGGDELERAADGLADGAVEQRAASSASLVLAHARGARVVRFGSFSEHHDLCPGIVVLLVAKERWLVV